MSARTCSNLPFVRFASSVNHSASAVCTSSNSSEFVKFVSLWLPVLACATVKLI